ncbi:MAG: GNAT family N-acetyltransferase [Chloroflexi bacterium]|nr:GNAT family N-acetyltransferase [Chloroflexota bacterium]
MIIAWGDKVGLRPFEDRLSDGEMARVYRWSRDEQILRWSGGAPTDLSLNEFKERLQNDQSFAPGNRRAFYIVTHSGELIGRIGCFAIDWDERKAEMGIVIGEQAYWAQGYGRDAVTTLLRHLFDTTSLRTINLFTYPDNLRAQRCFSACGFRVLGSARRFSPDVGEFDGLEMAITRDEFSKGVPRQLPSRRQIPAKEQK